LEASKQAIDMGKKVETKRWPRREGNQGVFTSWRISIDQKAAATLFRRHERVRRWWCISLSTASHHPVVPPTCFASREG